MDHKCTHPLHCRKINPRSFSQDYKCPYRAMQPGAKLALTTLTTRLSALMPTTAYATNEWPKIIMCINHLFYECLRSESENEEDRRPFRQRKRKSVFIPKIKMTTHNFFKWIIRF
jgi:hypothetical protein